MSEHETMLSAVHAAAGSERRDGDVVPKALHETAVTTARVEAKSEGESAAKTRCKAILGSEHAKGREELANYFAFDTDMSADQATAALAKSPVAAPAAPTGLAADMARETKVDLGAGGGATSAQMTDMEKGAAEARRLLGKPDKR